jgi:hypothetical protein
MLKTHIDRAKVYVTARFKNEYTLNGAAFDPGSFKK